MSVESPITMTRLTLARLQLLSLFARFSLAIGHLTKPSWLQSPNQFPIQQCATAQWSCAPSEFLLQR